MAKKILLNIVLNIGIITIVLCIIWAFNQKYYTYFAGAILVLAILIYFKIRLVKNVRNMTKRF